MLRLASIKGALDETVQYTYDAYGKLTKIKRGSTEYNLTYNTWRQPFETKIGTASFAKNTYDDYHRLSTVEYGNQFTVRYVYDSLDRVKEIYQKVSSSATETLAYTFFYNGDGDLYELRNYRTNRVSLYEYDHTGRCMACTERSFTVSGSTFTYGSVLSRYRYQYDLADNLTKLSCYALGNSWDTTYTYDIPNRLYKTKLSSNVEVHNKLNVLGLYAKRTIKLASDYVTDITYINSSGSYAPLVWKYKNGSDSQYVYAYDDNGNITSITQGSTSITYEYDSENRLTRENNQVTNQSVKYTYDVWGNITNKSTYAYTTGTLGTPTSSIDYDYDNSAWKDKLTEYNGQDITYDGMGNPLSYRGYTFGWRGKQLTTASNGTNTFTFSYNEDGLRQQKICNSVTTDYYYNGSVLIAMQRGSTKMLFSYDTTGKPASIKYNGTEYYYVYNAQGDVIKLIDSTGAAVVQYTYDTWGKKISITGSLASSVGKWQPFRYRGYVYDEESGFYYLQSRYYDPTTGRFISADVLLSTGQGIIGYNAFAYCNDNPVRCKDSQGQRAVEGDQETPSQSTSSKYYNNTRGRFFCVEKIIYFPTQWTFSASAVFQ